MKVILAQPRGFCAGVVRAIDIVERALATCDAPVYVRHEIVHNRHVVDGLKARGARFVEELDEIPGDAVAIFSAHGVSRAVESEAADRKLRVIDATCPLVTKVHNQGQRYASLGRTVLFIGHAGHPEVEGTLGRITGTVHLVESREDVLGLPIPDDTPVAYITQTTLSVDDTRQTIEAIQKRFSDVIGPETRDICYATQNRQTAVRNLCRHIDVLLVVGSANSSNSNRLREIGEELGIPSYLVADGRQVDPAWLVGKETIGITAGASAPDVLVDDVVGALAKLGPVEIQALQGVEEKITFRLPRELLEAS
ncbi:4-hydroxy-3-methylbut-2-enyl diphosphate reductase [Hyphomicrobium sp.]|jgi:4-hydroxy-3-methylbut-2-enyl diphosphate reductase|uniref:4-hydroxy-3-methylbut-2-enyl diphosphate reductase n=1 Tax=Hyphomicrobium sp. TaxID=82 RepID=UPI002B97CC43|nr:4-hydroxy-3-methylbut-2-enyl diphosphate reductase [Hyphomicrobium sp.]HVZ03986.1 4-hydroxy-3-methylbut-2-enyl diphosphate reductase [Hyphomicrobium sp.]